MHMASQQMQHMQQAHDRMMGGVMGMGNMFPPAVMPATAYDRDYAHRAERRVRQGQVCRGHEGWGSQRTPQKDVTVGCVGGR